MSFIEHYYMLYVNNTVNQWIILSVIFFGLTGRPSKSIVYGRHIPDFRFDALQFATEAPFFSATGA
jgi:hypothetical protein